MLIDYIFLDSSEKIVQEGSYRDDDAAEAMCTVYAYMAEQEITCYRHVCQYTAEMAKIAVEGKE